MRTAKVISTQTIYGSKYEESFRTTDEIHSIAYDNVYPRMEAIKKEIGESGRFHSKGRLAGRIKEYFEIGVKLEIARLREEEAERELVKLDASIAASVTGIPVPDHG